MRQLQRVKINNKGLFHHGELGNYIEDCSIFMFHGIVQLDNYPDQKFRFMLQDIKPIKV